jgi:hypothetical protein
MRGRALERAWVFTFAIAAVLAACAGRNALPAATGAGGAASSAVTGASSVSVTLALTIQPPALGARTLELYAYPLPPAGPLKTPPPSSRIGAFDVSAKSPQCKTAGSGRSCSLSVSVPAGQDAVIALLSTRRSDIGESFVAFDAQASASLAMIAGDVTPTQLTLTIPSLRERKFNVAATAWSNFTTAILTDLPTTPIVISIYGPKHLVPNPRETVGGRGLVAPFTWSGAKLANPMTVAAISGTSSITGLIFPPATPVPNCSVLGDTNAYTVAESNVLSPKATFKLGVSVADSKKIGVTIDTGSTSLLLSRDLIVKEKKDRFIGPGQAGSETLYPHDITLLGNYYLAPVTLWDATLTKRLGKTVPMEVFVVDKSCVKDVCTESKTTAYLGVGFGRPSPAPTNGFLKSPAENAFLQLSDVVVDQDMHPGFILSKDSLSIGLNRTNARGFSYAKLDAFAGRPGDWQGPKACVVFDGGYSAPHCGGAGTMLLDVGIPSMYVKPTVSPQPSTIAIVAPDLQQRLLGYSFANPNLSPSPSPTPPAPTAVMFETPPPSVYVNTGRYALAATDYLYDEACGRVGFRSPTP